MNTVEVPTFADYVERLLRNQPRFGAGCPVYAITTENIAGYLEPLNLRGKRLLCVAASGDHLLNALAAGAKSVTLFDINLLAFHWCHFKLAALKTLPRKDFIAMFTVPDTQNTDGGYFTYERFVALKRELPEHSARFFEHLFRSYDYEGMRLRRSTFFVARDADERSFIARNVYLQSEVNYNDARCNAIKVNFRFISSCICNLNSQLNESYDVISLSNIGDHAARIFPGTSDYLEKFVEQAVLPLAAQLTPGGLMQAAYLYQIDGSQIESPHSRLDIRKERERVLALSGFSYEEHAFESVIAGARDAVILLRKEAVYVA